jgi:hypothetical protein
MKIQTSRRALFSNVYYYFKLNFGHAMAQAVSRRPLTAEAQVSLCGICGEQRGTETGFALVFPCQYHSTLALHFHIIWGMNKMPAGGCVSET